MVLIGKYLVNTVGKMKEVAKKNITIGILNKFIKWKKYIHEFRDFVINVILARVCLIETIKKFQAIFYNKFFLIKLCHL